MKPARGRKARRRAGGELAAGFTRGFVATGLLAALQDRGPAPEPRRVLRLALQGGAAMAAGTVAAEALARRDWNLALTAVAAGGAGVLAAQRLLQDANFKEIDDEQEED